MAVLRLSNLRWDVGESPSPRQADTMTTKIVQHPGDVHFNMGKPDEGIHQQTHGTGMITKRLSTNPDQTQTDIPFTTPNLRLSGRGCCG
jgi:hypothetical protein